MVPNDHRRMRDDDLPSQQARWVRSVLDRRRTRAMATGIVMAVDDVDIDTADARITACAVRRHLAVSAVAASICRTHRYP
ncbi:hypothetical protein [Rhodococcus sp. NBC_00297]|uniref:hypothetical protein n=1 Tax=Rhodococcus sp. NBC_00297 TaxID=2976005 RepID=UPI002E2DC766|nr:hypothetical protein [Rhodococcus sp. NBC_00297]